ncbi:hypothetical protein IGB42_02649 [Andreprevotia sp. IGB-42]|uniref:hypothetical protein n=1 Tax=Andreprevotia sp. IGB-42 TaxID=2497473 RepID=UPI001357A9A4|nr:hypothetical protein [Andreprevotia sp. IGB-42]KAF0812806.1 hypothetical protein IGB42_02649 [Andreprevotia sp. IGB-42]
MTTVADQIRAATATAQERMNEYDAQVLQDLRALFVVTADDIGQQIVTAAAGDNQVSLMALDALRQRVIERLAKLTEERNALLNRALPHAATLGTEPFSGHLPQDYLVRGELDAVRFVQQLVQADGLKLSDRLWRNDRQATARVANEIELAIVRGISAQQAARDMLARGRRPDATDPGLQAANPVNIARATTDALTGQGGSAYYNAARVFRTELNRAHGTAYQNVALQHPDVIGTRFLLSPHHLEHDICDTHASADLYGLGKGVYPHGKNPWPAHPNTLSYVVAVFRSDKQH